MKTSQNTPVSREERTYNELTRLFKKPGTHPAGLYVGAFTVAQQARYRWTSDGREICVSVEAVEVTVTLTDPKIYVGSELADDDCARELVWQHEVLHYRIDQDVLERFTPAIQRTVEFAVKKAGSQTAKSGSTWSGSASSVARTVRQHLDRVSTICRASATACTSATICVMSTRAPAKSAPTAGSAIPSPSCAVNPGCDTNLEQP